MKDRGMWTAWNATGVIARVKDVTIENMAQACEVVEEDMRRRAPEQTGRLKAAIDSEVVVESDGSITGLVGIKHGFARTHIARFFEFGTRKMAARPFMRPALLSNLREIGKILQGEK